MVRPRTRNRAIYSGRAPSRRRGGAGSARRPARAAGRVGPTHRADDQPDGACTRPHGRRQNCAAALHVPIPHCDGPRCRHGSPRRLRGGARAPRSVAPVSGATPGRFPRILERGECLSCTAAGTRFSTSSATSAPARRTRGRQKLPPGLQGRRPTPGLWSSSFDGSWILSMRAARRLMEGRARSRSRAVCAARRAAPRRARAGMGRAGTWAEDASENPSGGARQAAAAAPTRAR